MTMVSARKPEAGGSRNMPGAEASQTAASARHGEHENVDRRNDLVDLRHADRVPHFAETRGTRGADGFYEETDKVTRAG